MTAQWTAIVLAGQRPGIDVVAQFFGSDLKALVRLGGEPMVTRVVRTLNRCPEVGHIVVIAQEKAALQKAVALGGGATILKGGKGISSSIKAIAGTTDAPWPVFVTTADHPLLTPDMVAEFLGQAQGDLSVGMVERKVMMAQFPDAKRTWLRFADGAWSGANLFALRTQKTQAALELWSKAEQDRKQAWKLFLHFGPLLALRAITRTIGLRNALGKAGRRLGLEAHLVAMSDPVAAIDVDKPADHVLAERLLRERGALPAGKQAP